MKTEREIKIQLGNALAAEAAGSETAKVLIVGLGWVLGVLGDPPAVPIPDEVKLSAAEEYLQYHQCHSKMTEFAAKAAQN